MSKVDDYTIEAIIEQLESEWIRENISDSDEFAQGLVAGIKRSLELIREEIKR